MTSQDSVPWSSSAQVGDSKPLYWSFVCLDSVHCLFLFLIKKFFLTPKTFCLGVQPINTVFGTVFDRLSLTRKHGCHISRKKTCSSSIPNMYLRFLFVFSFQGKLRISINFSLSCSSFKGWATGCVFFFTNIVLIKYFRTMSKIWGVLHTHAHKKCAAWEAQLQSLSLLKDEWGPNGKRAP